MASYSTGRFRMTGLICDCCPASAPRSGAALMRRSMSRALFGG